MGSLPRELLSVGCSFTKGSLSRSLSTPLIVQLIARYPLA